jgi:hypothetical protein
MREETMVSIVFPDRTCLFIRKTNVRKVIEEWQKEHTSGFGHNAFFAIKEVIKFDGVCNEVEIIKV